MPPLRKGKKRLFLRRPKNKGAPSLEARAALRKSKRLQPPDCTNSLHDSAENIPTKVSSEEPSFCLGFDVPPSTKCLRVLSLFNGISTGLVALDSLGVNVGAYYASEIDPDALAISRKRFHGRIIEIGCVTSCTEQLLDEISPIHLLLGGSPCDQLSRVNPRRKIFAKGSSGRLFFNFINVLQYLKKKSVENNHDFHYLFENTANLDHSTLATMTKHFNAEPKVIDALSFVPMRRKRLFWHNLGESGIDLDSLTVPPLEDYLDAGRRANVEFLSTITTNRACQKKGDKLPAVDYNSEDCPLNVNELERIFGLGEGFTDNGSLSICRRQKLIGKSWVVPVICYILNPLLNN